MIIAPTHGYKRKDPDAINDTIKDSPDAIRLEKGYAKIIVGNQGNKRIENKQYQDMRVIHEVNKRIDDRYIRKPFYDAKEKIVVGSYPDMSNAQNNKYLRGLDTW